VEGESEMTLETLRPASRVLDGEGVEASELADDLRQVVHRCLAGDQGAMIDLVDRYQAAVFRFCYRMLGHRQDAEDAAQETFVRVLRSLSRWDSQRDFRPWLMTIAANRCRTMLAARKRRPVACSVEGNLCEDDCHDWHEADQLNEEIQLGLTRICPEHREAFVLFHEHDLSYQQIADILGCPLGTCKTWIYRARRQLAVWLQKRQVVSGRRNELR
jgi:RNA polymerase sigma-70 factor, ECF subfamily